MLFDPVLNPNLTIIDKKSLYLDFLIYKRFTVSPPGLNPSSTIIDLYQNTIFIPPSRIYTEYLCFNGTCHYHYPLIHVNLHILSDLPANLWRRLVPSTVGMATLLDHLLCILLFDHNHMAFVDSYRLFGTHSAGALWNHPSLPLLDHTPATSAAWTDTEGGNPGQDSEPGCTDTEGGNTGQDSEAAWTYTEG